MTTLVFLDTETTGLDPDRHEVWEIGCIVRDHRDEQYNGEWLWQLRPNLALADPTGLRIGRYYERIELEEDWDAVRLVSPWAQPPQKPTNRDATAWLLAVILDGAHMVGAVPSFDAAFLSLFLRAHGQAPAWHYHLVDVEALAAGYLAGTVAEANAARAARGDERPVVSMPDPRPPWKSDELSEAVGVVTDDDARHTALGDARWAMAIYDAVMGGAEEPT